MHSAVCHNQKTSLWGNILHAVDLNSADTPMHMICKGQIEWYLRSKVFGAQNKPTSKKKTDHSSSMCVKIYTYFL